ncbi:MAG TPA: hypothetical protein VMV41_13420, partial [Cellulomonadaceae bacterium]|nr:hypothetical protein [Cellulomonadaceae bacterium]
MRPSAHEWEHSGMETERLGDRRAQVLTVVRTSRIPLDDDEIALTARMNRHYVNAICRELAAEQIITRERGTSGKLVNAVADLDRTTTSVTAETPRRASAQRRTQHRSSDRMNANIEELVDGFASYVTTFEASQAFPGPSLYFHERAIERRRAHDTVGLLLGDTQFLECVYAVLPAWGMHRMGPQTAKVGDLQQITKALRECEPALETLWPLRITSLPAAEAEHVAATTWDVIERIKVSTSRTQIVAGSKFLHHLLPDLLPPIDRQYTFR